MANKPRPQLKHCDIVTGVALTAPAVRLVVVNACAFPDPDGDGFIAEHVLYPVLAIEATIRQSFSARADSGPRGHAPTPEAMEQLGWRYSGGGLGASYDPVVLTHDYGICGASFAFDWEAETWEVFACEWSRDEDETRLAEEIARLRDKALSQAKDHFRKKESA